MMPRRFACVLLFLAVSAQAADALILSCFPVRQPGRKIEAYVDGVAPGKSYPPKHIEDVTVLARLGEDAYEYMPEHVKELTLRDGLLRIHLFQPLSAGQTAEIRMEGKIAAQKGESFTMSLFLRGEQRTGEGSLRCTIAD